MKKVKKVLFWFVASILGVSIILMTILFIVLRKDIETLSTIKKLDEYGIYQMTYLKDYRFDKLIEESPKNSAEMNDFMRRNIFHNFPSELQGSIQGCSVFTVKNEKGEVLFCRNMEYEYFMPGVALYTSPDNGYRSFAMSDLEAMGYNKKNLPEKDGFSLKALLMLGAPYTIKDGMNEKGLAVACLRSNSQEVTHIEGAPIMNKECLMRYVLDHAANVEEAIELIKQCNLRFEYTFFHLIIADAKGRSVVVEYYDHQPHFIESDVVTNFDLHTGLVGTGYDRYEKIKQAIEDNHGVMTKEQALDTLYAASMGKNMFIWSIVYNLTTGEISFFANGKRSEVKELKLELAD